MMLLLLAAPFPCASYSSCALNRVYAFWPACQDVALTAQCTKQCELPHTFSYSFSPSAAAKERHLAGCWM